jgi:Protein of unknown function (DUF2439)
MTSFEAFISNNRESVDSRAEASTFSIGSPEMTETTLAGTTDESPVITAGKKAVLACVYTKHKVQKRKVWNDGRLVIFHPGRAVLYSACPLPGSGDPIVDTCELTPRQSLDLVNNRNVGNEQLETDKFLITVEGPWSEPVTAVVPVEEKASAGLRKVITTKFRKPGGYLPPPPTHPPASSCPSMLGKRRQQPLRPGELIRRHYGAGTGRRDEPMRPDPLAHQDDPWAGVAAPQHHHPAQTAVGHSFHFATRPPNRQSNGPVVYPQATPVEISANHQQHDGSYNDERPMNLQPNNVRFPNSASTALPVSRDDVSGTRSLLVSRNGFRPQSFYGDDEEASDADTAPIFTKPTGGECTHPDSLTESAPSGEASFRSGGAGGDATISATNPRRMAQTHGHVVASNRLMQPDLADASTAGPLSTTELLTLLVPASSGACDPERTERGYYQTHSPQKDPENDNQEIRPNITSQEAAHDENPDDFEFTLAPDSSSDEDSCAG